jgi:hypothetical protein
MPLVLEDGTGKTDSNTYVLEATFTQWLSDRGLTLAGDLTVDNLLYQSADYLETLQYIGNKKTQAQAMQWPRENVYIDGFAFSDNAIPQELIDAQMQTAYSIDQGENPLATVGRATKREKVDVIEVEYQDNASSTSIITAVNATLRKLLATNSGSAFKAYLSI